MIAHESSKIPAFNPASVKICYADTSLRTNAGHFANSCRHIVGELRRRGFAVDVYGHRSMPPALVEELEAIPFFRHASIENILAHAPISMLHQADFGLARLSFLQDLKLLWSRGPYDFIFVNSIFPAQLAELSQWLQTLRAEDVPDIAAEFGTPSGVGIADRAMAGSPNWRRLTVSYRKAAELLDGKLRRPFLFTFDSTSTADYAQLLHVPVETMPAIQSGLKEPRLRCRTDGFLTISFIGHQRAEKGYQLIPEIIRYLRGVSSQARYLVHNGNPEDEAISRQLRTMAEGSSDLMFEHRPAAGEDWQDLLDRSDLVVLPYERERYRASYSAIAVEAVSGAIPMVVPKGTTMETLGETFGSGITTFGDWKAEPIAKAIEQAMQNFDQLAALSFGGASRWRSANGVECFVDRLLELLPLIHKNRMAGGASVHDRILNLGLDLFFSVTVSAMTSARAVLLSYRRIVSGL